MSGSLLRCKRSKRTWKKLWFLIKDKVLYTFTTCEVRGHRLSPVPDTVPIPNSVLLSRHYFYPKLSTPVPDTVSILNFVPLSQTLYLS